MAAFFLYFFLKTKFLRKTQKGDLSRNLMGVLVLPRCPPRLLKNLNICQGDEGGHPPCKYSSCQKHLNICMGDEGRRVISPAITQAAKSTRIFAWEMRRVISPANIKAAKSAGYHSPRKLLQETSISSSSMLKLQNSWPPCFWGKRRGEICPDTALMCIGVLVLPRRAPRLLKNFNICQGDEGGGPLQILKLPKSLEYLHGRQKGSGSSSLQILKLPKAIEYSHGR